MSRERIYTILQWGGWSTAVAFFFSLRFIFSPTERVQAVEVFNWFAYLIGGVLVTNWLRRLIRRKQWLDLPFGRLWYRLLLSGALLGLILTIQVVSVGGGWRILRGERFPVEFFWGMWVNASFVVLLWISIYVTVSVIRRYNEEKMRALALELSSKEVRLANLQAQVNPHFLFNSLNSVRALIGEDPAKATEAVTWLAGILRYSLRSEKGRQVALAEEMDFVEQYLALEKLRFEARLEIELAVEENTKHALVPPLLIQTLVENSIKHGIAELPQGGKLLVRVLRREAELEIVVENTGRLTEVAGTSGIGLRNARERLELLHGEAASLSLTQTASQVVARVRLPYAEAVVAA